MKSIIKKINLILCFILFIPSVVLATNPNHSQSIPRFGIVKSAEANLRNGPHVRYPIKWILTKAKEPVEIIGAFEKWKKVRDFQGDEGWIHDTLLSNKRRAIIKRNNETRIYKRKNPQSPTIAIIKPLVRIDLIKCESDWCYIKVQKYKGWIDRKNLWGVYEKETF